jgi:cytochrome c biogenesis protein CcdA
MREALDQSTFVMAAYALGMGATALLIAWSWLSMRRAEKRRDKSRER